MVTHLERETASLCIGDEAPNFEAETTFGPIDFHRWIGDSWSILFSHPKDFTPVCTTEIAEASRLKSEFEKRHCKIIGLSVSSLAAHLDWIRDINASQKVEVNFPLIADEKGFVAHLYGMIHAHASDTSAVRSVFIIDPSKKVRLTLAYPASTGRNFKEIIRVLDSLQLTDHQKVATPAGWEWGGECVILPAITDPVEIKRLFPKGYRQVTPYLRFTPQPDSNQ